jgi:asparagine synthase (glutamine-hydrolysing)
VSGFLCVVNLNGAPIDRAQLQGLTNSLRFRGPDAQDVWVSDQVGFGHAMLRTTEDATREHHPCSLDGRTWLTGDVRVDGRKDLVRELEAAGQTPPKLVSDAELVLHAYRAWGPGLVDHLLGDFSFAIWDGGRRTLFCARDPMGVKPFFYAVVGTQLLASNTLVCLRAHPAMPDELSEQAVGDFLLFGFSADPTSTTFAAIKRLPGGHRLFWSPGQDPRVERYWTLPSYPELRLKRAGDYVERFRDILAEAVADRLRTDRALVHMSGGLDSTLIAATAKALGRERPTPLQLEARTVEFRRSFDDEERHFSRLAAEQLGVSITYLDGDDYPLFDDASARTALFPEPSDALVRPSFFDALNHQGDRGCRVALSGYDGDALLTASWSRHLGSRAREGRIGSLASDVVRYLLTKQKLGRAIGRRLLPTSRGRSIEAPFPNCFEPGFEQRAGLRERWGGLLAGHDREAGARDGAYRAMTLPTWFPILDGRDAGMTGVPVEHRHPLLDLRMVEFCLSLPAIPWCIDKHIVREAAKGLLPEPVRTRPKSPLGGDPMPLAIRAWLSAPGNSLSPHPALTQFIDIKALPRLIDGLGTAGYWLPLRVFLLNFWLNSLQGAPMSNPLSKEAEKRPFKAPKLEVYGRARDITRNVGSKGNADGGSGAGSGPKTR